MATPVRQKSQRSERIERVQLSKFTVLGRVSGHEDGTLHLWNTNTLELLQTIQVSTSDIADIVWHSTENILASASYDKSVVLWKINVP